MKEKFNVNTNDFINKFKELKSVYLIADYYGRQPCVIYDYIKRNNLDIEKYKERKKTSCFNPDKDYFIKIYDELKSARKVAEIFNVDKTTILTYAKKIGYKNHYRPELTEEQIQYVCSQYYLKLAKDLADELNVSKSLITKTWSANGLIGKINRMYYCDENYFEIIDTPAKAYILGLIASDGCIYKRENHTGLLSLSFHEQEIELLNIVKRELKSNQPILHHNNIINLAISSDKICNDLSKYNILQRKTWIYKPIDLQNNELTWHYLRGYLDGDGSIYSNADRTKLYNWQISYCGNKYTINYISDFLESHNILHEVYQDKRDKYLNEFYCLRISTIDEIKDMIDNLYLNSHNIRGRKYEYALEFLHLYNNKTNNMND